MDSEQRLRTEFRDALAAVTPEAPWLRHAVAEKLRSQSARPRENLLGRFGPVLGLAVIGFMALLLVALLATHRDDLRGAAVPGVTPAPRALPALPDRTTSIDVRGTVVDDVGAPLAGVQVSVVDSTHVVSVSGGVSDAAGRYRATVVLANPWVGFSATLHPVLDGFDAEDDAFGSLESGPVGGAPLSSYTVDFRLHRKVWIRVGQTLSLDFAGSHPTCPTYALFPDDPCRIVWLVAPRTGILSVVLSTAAPVNPNERLELRVNTACPCSGDGSGTVAAGQLVKIEIRLVYGSRFIAPGAPGANPFTLTATMAP